MRLAPAAPTIQGAPRQHQRVVPALPGTRPAAPQQPPSGQVFATQVVKEEPVADDVVAGIISINNVRRRALFDTGASYSFISRSFATTHGLDVLQSTNATTIQVPEHSFEISEYCPACPVRISEWIMTVDFLVLRRLGDFHAILGMN